jgi:hypothetical protein
MKMIDQCCIDQIENLNYFLKEHGFKSLNYFILTLKIEKGLHRIDTNKLNFTVLNLIYLITFYILS